MKKLWTVLIILIQLNYSIVGSMFKDSIVDIVCVDIENSFDQVAIFADARHTSHTIEQKEDQNHHEAVETSVVESEYLANTSFDLIAHIVAPATDLAFSEYYLHHLPSVFEKINIPPPRA